MALLSSSFLILYAVLQQTVYFSAPTGTIEAFICIDDGFKNDSWPAKWDRMVLNNTRYHGQLWEYTLSDKQNNSLSLNSIKCKVKFIFENRTHGDTPNWIEIILRHPVRDDVPTENCLLILIMLVLMALYAISITIYYCVKKYNII